MLKQQVEADLKEAMRSGDDTKRSVLRMLLSAVRNKEIDVQKKDMGLSDEEVLDVIRSEVKKRKDSIEGYEKGGRTELAEKEQAEMILLQSYLPPELSEEEVIRIIKDGIRESGALSMHDFAKVMKVIMPILKGKASGDRISALLKKELSRDGGDR